VSRAHRWCAGVAIAVAGCSVLPSPEVPDLDFVVLSPVEAAAAADTVATTTVALDRVRMPAYLERPEVVTRVSDNEIEFSTRERWAETLAQAVPRVLALDLAAAVGGQGIAVSERLEGTAEYVVEVAIVRFERTAAGRAELHARWTLRGAGGVAVDAGELRASEDVPAARAGSPPGAASAASLSRLLSKLGVRIAADIRQARGQAPPRAP